MPDHACATHDAPDLDDPALDEDEVKAATSLEAEARLREMAAISEFCQRSLIELVNSGTKLAKLVADWAESDGAIELRQGRGAVGFKGGLPATKAFAVVGQAVRRSILLLQKVMHLDWWQDVPAPRVAAAPARPAEDGAGAEIERREVAGDPAETLDRLDRVEAFAADVTPAQVRRVIGGLAEDIAEARELARQAMDEEPDVAAEPQDWDAEPLQEPRRHPPDD